MSDGINSPATTGFSGPGEAAEALIELLAVTRRQLLLYCPLLAPALFARPEIADGLRRLVVGQSRLQARMLLPPVVGWRSDCPVLAALIERLGALELRIPPRDEPDSRAEQHYGFVLADQRELLVLRDPRRCLGYRSRGGAQLRELLTLFDTLWEKSRPDRELRRLAI